MWDFLLDDKINGADLLSYVVGAGLLLYGLRRLRKRPWAAKPAKYVHEPSTATGVGWAWAQEMRSHPPIQTKTAAEIYGEAQLIDRWPDEVINAESVDVTPPYDWREDDS